MGAQRYTRVIKRAIPPAPKTRGKLGKYDVPVQAVKLAEDILAIEVAMGLLKEVERQHITKTDTQADRDFADAMYKSVIGLLRTWSRYGRLKMRKEFLAP